MDQWLPSFADELEKIAICVTHSSFMQARKGRRPIRAHNLLKKETAFKEDKDVQDASHEEAKDHEAEAGSGLMPSENNAEG
jgi:hypothetical protein